MESEMTPYVKVKLQDGGTAVLHPQLADTMQGASLCIEAGASVYFKWTCLHCGVRQTFEEKNTFHVRGKCEECNNTSDLLSPSADVGFMMQAGSPMEAIELLFGKEEK